MNGYVHNGTTFDLDGDFADAVGVVWSWTGSWSPAGEPMLQSDAPLMALPLPDVDYYNGPLIPVRRKTSRTPSEAFAATVAAGYVEDVEAFGARIGGQS